MGSEMCIRDSDTTVRHECSLQRFVCLETNNFFEVLSVWTNISWFMCCKRCYDVCIHIKDTSSLNTVFTYAYLVMFFLLKSLKFFEQFVSCSCWACKELFVTIIWCVVILNKVTYVTLFRITTHHMMVTKSSLQAQQLQLTNCSKNFRDFRRKNITR